MNAIQQHLYFERKCKKCKDYKNPQGTRGDGSEPPCGEYYDEECCNVELVKKNNNIWWVPKRRAIRLCSEKKEK